MSLEIADITCRYGKATAVADLSITLNPGQIVGLLGPNGAGKSTVLRAISGLVPTICGDIELDGEKISDCSPVDVVRAGVSHVPEGRRLFADQTVTSNLRIGGHVAPEGREERIDELIRLAPSIDVHRDRLAGVLSGGQQQLVAILRGLMSEPRYLLLDEPLNGLSPAIRTTVLELIKTVAGRGVGVLLVEQLVGPALSIADQAVVLRGGRRVLTLDRDQFQSSDVVFGAYVGQ